MQRIGAVALKNTVYILPSAENTLEDFQWTVREIRAGGGEANVFEARVVEGLTDAEIQQVFNTARDEDYAPLVKEARALRKHATTAALQRLRDRMNEIQAIDYFGAAQGHNLAALLDQITSNPATSRPRNRETYLGRTWVTRAGVHIDRMSSAWLIRRFIDTGAKFKFVQGRHYKPEAGEIRFDMFDAEFTHEGDACTFEVLARRMRLDEPAIAAIGEIVHDVDLKEARFNRPETAGIAVAIASINMANPDDDERVARAAALLDDLYVYYSKQKR